MQKDKAKSHNIVQVIMNSKSWEMTETGALATISVIKHTYTDEGKHAIIAVKKGNAYVMVKQLFETKDDLVQEVSNWVEGGYTPFFTEL